MAIKIARPQGGIPATGSPNISSCFSCEGSNNFQIMLNIIRPKAINLTTRAPIIASQRLPIPPDMTTEKKRYPEFEPIGRKKSGPADFFMMRLRPIIIRVLPKRK
ncbi:MAG: hypothetical protein CSB22_00685 [Deltaproteobacteria bacterium]|nr:MAG: hypothetical protein CSB22_00685 [Deltaproteobacteria bacterium]